jgi:hypothetical protein
MPDTTDQSPSYLRGLWNIKSSYSALLWGGTDLTGSLSVYLYGGGSLSDSIGNYLSGIVLLLRDSAYAYLAGISGSHLSAYVAGTLIPPGETEMPEYDFIWLKTSDLSKQFKFRVVAQGYDDGTLEKAEELKRTIGGGYDHSMGAVYQSWNPIIRVRASEPLTDYGTTGDLADFYKLNDPGGTPSNNITFVDHHGQPFTVHMTGTFQKSLLGARIEGNEAWSIVKLKLVEVTT